MKPLKVLILGGTGFIGPHLVRELRAGGHQLTLFNRGKRNPGLFPDIETVIGDRNGPLDVLQGSRMGRGGRRLRLLSARR